MINTGVWQKELAPVTSFKLGLIADEASQDLDEAAALAHSYGATGLEIRSVYGKQLTELTDEDLSNIKKTLKKHKMVCCGISSPFFKCQPEEADEHLKLLDCYIRIAKELGTDRIRGFAFWKKPERPFSEVLPIIKEKLTEAALKLRTAGMTLLLENEPSTYDTDAAAIVEIIKAVDMPEIQGLWDPGNDIYTATREIPYPNGYELLRPWIGHFHIKDARRNEEDRPISVRFGDGIVDYVGQFERLSSEGYTGWLVLEPHYRSKALTEEQLMNPGGMAFSSGGMRATAECFEALLRFFDEHGYTVKDEVIGN